MMAGRSPRVPNRLSRSCRVSRSGIGCPPCAPISAGLLRTSARRNHCAGIGAAP
jgi:hypothetical protein